MTKEQQYIIHTKQLAEIHAAVQAMAPRVEQMHKSLYVGNGKDSIMTTIRLHGEDIEDLRGSKKTTGNRVWDFAMLIIAAAVALVGRWLLFRGDK